MEIAATIVAISIPALRVFVSDTASLASRRRSYRQQDAFNHLYNGQRPPSALAPGPIELQAVPKNPPIDSNRKLTPTLPAISDEASMGLWKADVVGIERDHRNGD